MGVSAMSCASDFSALIPHLATTSTTPRVKILTYPLMQRCPSYDQRSYFILRTKKGCLRKFRIRWKKEGQWCMTFGHPRRALRSSSKHSENGRRVLFHFINSVYKPRTLREGPFCLEEFCNSNVLYRSQKNRC